MARLHLILGMVVSATLTSCALFEPREPEPPSQSGSNFEPPYSAETVISNLKNAIAAKNLDNYIACFSDPLRTQRVYTFVPSAPAWAQYSGELSSWDREKERAYMQNLISRTSSNAFSSLLLVPKSFQITSDSVVHNYEYTFTFHHDGRVISDSTARGELWFTLGQDNSGLWSIYRWIDYPLTPTSTIITWSSFKGGFSSH